MDFLLKARMQNGVLLQGGVSTGRTTLDTCEVTNQIPEMMVSGVQLAVPGFPQAHGVQLDF